MTTRELTDARIAAYAQYLRAEEHAPATVEKYIRDIRSFAAWVNGSTVTKELSARWKASLIAEGLAPATVNAKLSAINGLFCFLNWEDCRVKFLKLQRRAFRDDSRELTKEEYTRLLDAAESSGIPWLETLLQTICATGIRVSEVRYITVEAAQTGRTEVSLKGKIRTILLPGKLCRKLLKYARKMKITSGEIFLTKEGKSVTRHQIWRRMKALCKGAGVEATKVFPHNLRHLFAATFYRATRDIVKLADVLGHSSINTTRIYLLSTGAEHVRQLDRLGLVS
ncbi:MAG: tyrosine-type recombinase/integrase [Oscillibacter sp.]|nr:tyrosine-type recombinase/integrase [Oscillibacter sp.]